MHCRVPRINEHTFTLHWPVPMVNPLLEEFSEGEGGYSLCNSHRCRSQSNIVCSTVISDVLLRLRIGCTWVGGHVQTWDAQPAGGANDGRSMPRARRLAARFYRPTSLPGSRPLKGARYIVRKYTTVKHINLPSTPRSTSRLSERTKTVSKRSFSLKGRVPIPQRLDLLCSISL